MQYLIVLTGFLVSISATISLFQANNLLLIHLASHGLLPKWFYQSGCKLNLNNNKSKANDVYLKTPLLTSLTTLLFFICVSWNVLNFTANKRTTCKLLIKLF